MLVTGIFSISHNVFKSLLSRVIESRDHVVKSKLVKNHQKVIKICKHTKHRLQFYKQRQQYQVDLLNKRAIMALNRSPESVSPQNEFYLLYYYCSNL